MHHTVRKLAHCLQRYTPMPDCRCSRHSVLIPLLLSPPEPHVLFCQRALSLKRQPGDVCFPGGRAEPGETPLETALRETKEEIGVPASQIQILGQPDYLLLPANRIVTPFVGILKCPLDALVLQKSEVETVFTVPLSYFLQTEPAIYEIQYAPILPEDFPYDKIVGGKSYAWTIATLPELFYEYAGHTIWGMTARMIYNVCQILNSGGNKNGPNC